MYNIFFPLNIGSFAVLKSFENIPKHSWNAGKSQGDPQKSSEELGIFGGLRLSQFVSGLAADHYFGVLGVFLSVSRVFRGMMGCSRGVPGLFQTVPGCSGGVLGVFWGCSGVFWGCSGVFRGVPGCSGCSRSVPGFTDTFFNVFVAAVKFVAQMSHFASEQIIVWMCKKGNVFP